MLLFLFVLAHFISKGCIGFAFKWSKYLYLLIGYVSQPTGSERDKISGVVKTYRKLEESYKKLALP